MDNLHFIPNNINILTIFFKELTKYKNDYQQYLNYIYIGIILCILLYIFKCIHAYGWGYKLVYIMFVYYSQKKKIVCIFENIKQLLIKF